MTKRLGFVGLYFILTIATLLGAVMLEYHIKRTREFAGLIASYNTSYSRKDTSFVAAVPHFIGDVAGAVVIHDARPAVLSNFFRSYGSPLTAYSGYFVDTADKYGMDYRLLPAIAMQESSGGKTIPDNSYNAWGYGVHERGTLRFSSWQHSIDTVARGIKRDYIGKGLVTPEQIMTKYTPASLAKGGAWAKGVRYFMEQMP